MNRKDIIPAQYILLVFGALIIAISIIKFQFVDLTLSPSFYIAEFITYGLIIAALYYLDYQLRKHIRFIGSRDVALNKMKEEFGKRESELLMKILKLEEKEMEELQYTVNKEKTISKIFHGIDQKQSKEDIAQQFLMSLSKSFEVVVGVFYLQLDKNGSFEPVATYALDETVKINPFIENEGFCGQAVADKHILTITDIPDDYLISYSGLGSSAPLNLYFIPIKSGKKIVGLVEIGTFKQIEIRRIWDDINNKLIDLLKIR